jgi:hypothetical protein
VIFFDQYIFYVLVADRLEENLSSLAVQRVRKPQKKPSLLFLFKLPKNALY